MIFVTAHKLFEHLKNFKEPNSVIIAGCDISKISCNFYKDNEKNGVIVDNISNKNYCYSELTVLYWIWKNCNDDIVGLQHYRRVFMKPGIKITGGYYKNGKKTSVFNNTIRERDIVKILEKKDIIVPRKIKFKDHTCKDELLKYVYEKDLIIFENYLKSKDKNAYDIFERKLQSNSSHYFNMFISKKSISNKYCEWLFNILFEYEKLVQINDYDVQHKRIFGYFSELLLDVYIELNELRYKEMKISFLTESKKASLRSLIGNLIDF